MKLSIKHKNTKIEAEGWLAIAAAFIPMLLVTVPVGAMLFALLEWILTH
ncbi:MAG: hypothetical protein AAFV59_04605 [Pseudomonadota bacterium]